MRHILFVTLLLGLALVPASPASAEIRLRITRRSLASVELDGGRVQGLAPGDRLRVVEGPATVAELEVIKAAQRSARCKVVSSKRPLRVGDVAVRPDPVAKRPTPAPASNGAASLPRATPAAAAPAPAVVAKAPAPAPEAPAPAPPPLAVQSRAPAAGSPASLPKPPAPVPALASAPPAPSPAPRASGPAFTVEYRSADSVYLDGGRAAGLEVGRVLQVLDGQTVVAELEVLYAAERSASCRLRSEARPVHQGDRAFLIGGASVSSSRVADSTPPWSGASGAAAAPASSVVPPETTSGEGLGRPWARAHGAASFGYYRSWDGFETDLDYQERTARVDLGLYDIAGQPFSFALRGRLREDLRARELSRQTPASLRTDRIYELALRYDPPAGRLGFELGRIGVSRFVGIGYLDGALVRFRARPGVQVGAFGGRQADIANLDGTGQKYGGFVRFSPAGRYTRGGYDVLLAFVRENAEGDVSREYLSLESRFAGGSRWSLFQRAELDVNRGWRQEASGKSYQFSNIGLSGNLKVSPSAWAFVSYDGLRNYRYYRNRCVPEDVFDSLLRQGLRAGVNVAKPGGFGANVGFGMSLKEQDPLHPDLDIANAYSFNGGVRHASLFRGFSLGLDSSGFTNGYTKGGLVSARGGWRAAAGHTLDLSFGYSRYRVEQTQQDRSQQWLRLIGRAELGRRFYVLGDLEYDQGDDLEGPRVFVELGVLF